MMPRWAVPLGWLLFMVPVGTVLAVLLTGLPGAAAMSVPWPAVTNVWRKATSPRDGTSTKKLIGD